MKKADNGRLGALGSFCFGARGIVRVLFLNIFPFYF
jgi:hypothetical protein